MSCGRVRGPEPVLPALHAPLEGAAAGVGRDELDVDARGDGGADEREQAAIAREGMEAVAAEPVRAGGATAAGGALGGLAGAVAGAIGVSLPGADDPWKRSRDQHFADRFRCRRTHG